MRGRMAPLLLIRLAYFLSKSSLGLLTPPTPYKAISSLSPRGFQVNEAPASLYSQAP